MDTAIPETEIRIEYYRASGPGGQHRNVTDSAVRIRHLPTGIVVHASESRSQAKNREVALRRLADALKKRLHKPKPRIPTKPTRAAGEKRLLLKKSIAAKKRLRSTPVD
ncbi:peptide chain release factor-like protein [Geobacter sp. DSM 9736]|uniref:peptide chain release factor family protein n=1 Tax=Geobacter sp. DSM 9736 TaxID=1277350 RepID=UPI001E3481C2|nr:peptide chain release factor-like protein [Geobacter sp. DSM 9736]